MDEETAGNGCAIFVANFIFIVFACIAANNANTAAVYDACGTFLRLTVILDIAANWIFWIALAIITCIFVNIRVPERTQRCVISIFTGIFTVILVFLSGWTLHYSVDAHQNQNCTDALSSNSGGMQSPSANTGRPFLLIMGYIYGVLYAIFTFVSLIATCCCGCLINA